MLETPRFARTLTYLFVSAAGSLVAFLLMHRGLELHPTLSSTILSFVYLPLLTWGLLLSVAYVLGHPRDVGHALVLAAGFTALTILFFAVLYSELGIVSGSDPRATITAFSTCLYFSASTFTTLGYGDFAPTPDARLLASVEALIGWLELGTLAAVLVTLLQRWADRVPR